MTIYDLAEETRVYPEWEPVLLHARRAAVTLGRWYEVWLSEPDRVEVRSGTTVYVTQSGSCVAELRKVEHTERWRVSQLWWRLGEFGPERDELTASEEVALAREGLQAVRVRVALYSAPLTVPLSALEEVIRG